MQTYGAEENRRLNITGEHLKNVIPARTIVGWYNGVPENSNLDIDLSKSTVAIFGQGNVAIDVSRILLTPIDQLKVRLHLILDERIKTELFVENGYYPALVRTFSHI